MSTNNGFDELHLLNTRVEEHFGGHSFPVYNSEEAKRGRIQMDWDRIVFTLGVIETHFSDPTAIKILELGANPYFLTEMIQSRFGSNIQTNGCPLGLTDGNGEIRAGVVSFENSLGGKRTIKNSLFNVEEERYPYDDSSFDLIICQELIEHLLFSPTFMLNEIHRVLKKGGKVIMTCPNVARIDVLRRIFANKNPTWGYVRVVGSSDQRKPDWPGSHGVYGRHNHEYTLPEATDLVRGCGFKILESECVTFYLPKVELSFSNPRLFLQTLIYRCMKSVTFLPLRFLQMKKDFVFIVAEKDSDRPIEYYPANLYDVWQVETDETKVAQERDQLNA